MLEHFFGQYAKFIAQHSGCEARKKTRLQFGPRPVDTDLIVQYGGQQQKAFLWAKASN
jgi:hypothetical protein